MNKDRVLGPVGLAAFERRKIDAETAVKCGIYTASFGGAGEMKPDEWGTVVVFPFRDHGVEVGRKYRAANKRFWQDVGGRRTFWNADIMDDPALEDGRHALIITEGEIDAMTAIDCGFPFAVSVPDGAPSVPKNTDPEKLEEIEAGNEATGKFEFMYNNRDRLKRIKRFIIASDADAPGRRLAAELVRRLSAARCSFVTYPPDPVVPVEGTANRACKDMNEVLMHLGRDAVVRVINEAKPYPVRGLYRLSEYPELPEIETFDVGFEGWERYLRVFAGEFMIVSGIPSHGKSAFVLNMIFNLAKNHGWRTALCSPEMPAVPILRDRFRRMLFGRHPTPLEFEEIKRADTWIEQYFTFIDTDPTGMGDTDEPFDLEWVIERATDAVLRDGIRILVIDPWNEIEHARQRNESSPDYIARGIRALKRFARLYGVMVIVVAHPTKDVSRDGKLRIPNLYDIEGAAHWYNKSDHGMIVEREASTNVAHIHLLKIKFEETGKRAKMTMEFDKESGTFKTASAEAT